MFATISRVCSITQSAEEGVPGLHHVPKVARKMALWLVRTAAGFSETWAGTIFRKRWVITNCCLLTPKVLVMTIDALGPF